MLGVVQGPGESMRKRAQPLLSKSFYVRTEKIRRQMGRARPLFTEWLAVPWAGRAGEGGGGEGSTGDKTEIQC